MSGALLENLGRIHTTGLGTARVRKNLGLDVQDIAEWCKRRVLTADVINRKGKNWYVRSDNCVITINARSYTIITAHIEGEKVNMPMDFKKEQKALYQPKTTPVIIDVPEMTFIAVDGRGDPNASAEYAAAVEMLYGLSYAVKMGNKTILEYVVPPLEGFWSVAGDSAGSVAATDKSRFVWTSAIRQPDFVTAEIFEAAKASLAVKKPGFGTSKARLLKYAEGLCVQALHTGPFDNEPATIIAMERCAAENGYVIDIGGTRRHHEIYLSDPRKTAPEKLKTVIRQPVRKAEG